MILSVQLHHFRRHESLTVAFTEGLNTLRGANEGGKTTVIEAILYAFYGSKALRDTLAETVTWGHKESELRSIVTYRNKDVMYVFNRSKNGAECKGDDGTVVTGQSEVSAFAADLLGGDAKTAALLMMASQSGLRGALDDGPAAVSGLMAKLADFDMIDRLLEAATQHLLLGSTTPTEQKLASAEEALGAATGSLPDEGKEVLLAAACQDLQNAVVACTAIEVDDLQPKVAAASDAVAAAEESNAKRTALLRQVQDVERRHADDEHQLKVAQATVALAPSDEALAEATAAAKAEVDWHELNAIRQKFQKISYPDIFWEGDWASLEEEITKGRGVSEAIAAKVNELNQRRSFEQGKRITSGKCPTCGHAANSDQHVAEHNAAIDAKLATINESLGVETQKLKEADGELKLLTDLHRVSRVFETNLSTFGDLIDLDRAFVPAKPSWVAPVAEHQPTGAASKRFAELKKLATDATIARGRVEAYGKSAKDLEAQYGVLVEEMKKIPYIDLEPLKLVYDQAYEIYAKNAANLREKKDALVLAQRDLDEHRRLVASAKAAITNLNERIKEYRESIKETEFNNVLVAKLKKIKPAITDHLWNITLGAVSTFFSSMRGETSVVSKDKDGFKVNGKSIESLSGSTLDVLALAVRVALTRTFIPHAAFMVLDEPAHGCDGERTGNVLGFLATAGFNQTILASHDELSEAVADNVIGLTA